MPYRWKSTREGSECAGYTWTAPVIDPDSRTIYQRTNSATPPANPTGAAEVPDGWSGAELCATSDERYVYCLTVTPVNGVWPDWSTAGTPVLFDHWTAIPYYWLAEGCESPPAPSVTWPTVPPDFTTAPQCRWKSTRSGSPCAGYAWSTTEIDACNEGTRTIYKPTATCTAPANPGGTDSVPEGWYGSKQCASSTKPCVYSLTVTTVNCVWPDWSTAGTPDRFDKWTKDDWWLLTTTKTRPNTPSGDKPGGDWVPDRPDLTTAPQCRWKSTRKGSKCAGYTWMVPAMNHCREEPVDNTFCVVTNSSSAPTATAVEAPQGATTHVPPSGAAWQRPDRAPCPTETQRYRWCVVIGGSPQDPYVKSAPAVDFAWVEAESVWGRLHASARHAPPTPSTNKWRPPSPWQKAPWPEVSAQMRGLWTTARSGHDEMPDPCDANVSFSEPELARAFMYTQYTYRLSRSGTTAPALPPRGPNSGGWNGQPADVTPTAAQPYRWVVARKRPTGAPGTQFGPWGEGAGNGAEVDLVFGDTQYAYKLSTSGTVAPARPPGGPGSGGWSPTPVVPNASQPYRWVTSRTRPTGPPDTPYGPWARPERDAEWQERSIWIAVTGGAPATPTVNYASTPSWSGPGIGSGWRRFPAPFLITQAQDDSFDFYSSSQSRVTSDAVPGVWSAWSAPSEFHPAVRPNRPIGP